MQLRSTAWSAVQSFPAADGSRTLRVPVPFEAIDAIHSMEASGIRQTYVWSVSGSGHKAFRRLMTQTEIRVEDSRWTEISQWLESTGRRRQAAHDRSPSRLPGVIYDHLRCGKLESVVQKMVADPRRSSGIRVEVSVTLPGTGRTETIEQYLAHETADVEMCVPLSRDEASTFFDDSDIAGIRHSFTIDHDSGKHRHFVEVLPQTGNQWEILPTNEVLVWNSVVLPHFRLTFSKKRGMGSGSTGGTSPATKDTVVSETPWVTSASANSGSATGTTINQRGKL